MVVRTSLGLQGYLLVLVVVGSVTLTFVAPKPRLLWSSLLAAVCGFCAGRLLAGWDATFGLGYGLLLLLTPPVVLGAAFAWRLGGWNAMAAGWLGIAYGAAAATGLLSASTCSDCGGETYPEVAVLIDSLAGAVLAIVGATLTVALRALTRRRRS